MTIKIYKEGDVRTFNGKALTPPGIFSYDIAFRQIGDRYLLIKDRQGILRQNSLITN